MNLKEPFSLVPLKSTKIGEPPGTLSYQGPYSDIGVRFHGHE